MPLASGGHTTLTVTSGSLVYRAPSLIEMPAKPGGGTSLTGRSTAAVALWPTESVTRTAGCSVPTSG